MELAPRSSVDFGGRYILGDRIGAGGVGVVYRAAQPALSRDVAIKLLHRGLAADVDAVRRFRTEAFAATRVDHPNTVMVLDQGTADDGTPYLVMEYVRGESLRAILRREKTLSVARVIAIAEQLLAGLGAAHRAGVVHADVKTDNIRSERARDGGDRIKLVDFGLAELSSQIVGAPDACPRAEWTVSGTPEYLAPEVVRGHVATALADLYSVGIVIYELLTGATPFAGGESPEVMRRHLYDDVVLPSLRRPDLRLPRELEAVVMRALAKSPGARFPDAETFAEALRGVPVLELTEAPRCEHCGDRGPDGARFCTACGTMAGAVAPAAGGDVITKVSTPRFARGSSRIAARTVAGETGRLRSEIGVAIVNGDVVRIADGYLALARVFVKRRLVDQAIRELAEAVDLLTVGGTTGSIDVRRLVAMRAGLES